MVLEIRFKKIKKIKKFDKYGRNLSNRLKICKNLTMCEFLESCRYLAQSDTQTYIYIYDQKIYLLLPV